LRWTSAASPSTRHATTTDSSGLAMSDTTAAAARAAGAATHAHCCPTTAWPAPWWAGSGGPAPWPARPVVALRPDGVFDLSRQHPTMSSLLDAPDPARRPARPGPACAAWPTCWPTAAWTGATSAGPGCWPLRPAGGQGRRRDLRRQPDRARDRGAGARRRQPRPGPARQVQA
jgi:hypothetical protein